jgi:general stress protein 26
VSQEDDAPFDRSDLWRIVAEIKTAMMTTQAGDGTLHSRPMLYAAVEPDGHIWFFTRANSWKVLEVSEPRSPVNLAYAHPESGRFLSLSGTAEIVGDRQKIAELWNEALEPWFPDGLNDPELQLIRVDLQHADFWDGQRRGGTDF